MQKTPQLDIKKLEENLKSYWEENKTYKFNPNSKKKIFSIDTPPPTLSGRMHIGHAFSYSQQDFIARFKRMSGNEVFYPFGTDDNGLPTERLIEKLKGVKSKDLSRQEFIDLCLKTLKKITPAFIQDWKNLAVSCDFDIYYSTIDKNSRKISQQSFLELYKSGELYQEDFPTLYCPECQTPIAQAELEDRSLQSQFTTLKFSTSERDTLPIATTRPELLGACVAVFVNPKDKRYGSFIGKKATVPIFSQEVPILEDESAQIEKGTGVLMICSYGDKYDVDAIKRHRLQPKIVLNKEGKLTTEKYKGLSIKEARKKILEDLEKNNLIIEQSQIQHSVNVHDKCGTEIEFIPTKQWFIKILDKKSNLLKQAKKINWFPKHMFKRYEQWVKGLEWDWSISRDRHFGIPIPVWHCLSCSEIILPKESELPTDPQQTKKSCPKCKCASLPETKVLDTWATSSLTPKIAASLTKNIKLPYSLRPQAHDIIRTWAFYTIVKAMLHENKIPWENISISGFAKLSGEKMSKSKGNVISPQEVMQNFGSDALRFWAASSKLGEDLDYQESDLITGKKFITKLLNATNFVFNKLEHQEAQPKKLHPTDHLLLQELNSLIESATKEFKNYNYSKAHSETQSFFWKTLADNYLEIVKNRFYNGTKEEKASAFYTLYNSLLTILKLSAPITPFITEHIYQEHFKKYESYKSIHTSDWPTPISLPKHRHDKMLWQKLTEIIYKVRQAKSLANQPMNSPISLTLSKADQKLLALVLDDLRAVTTAKLLETGQLSIKFL